MVLGANDKNNGGYSIEDILEEVRRMRKEQTKKPGGVDRPKQSPMLRALFRVTLALPVRKN